MQASRAAARPAAAKATKAPSARRAAPAPGPRRVAAKALTPELFDLAAGDSGGALAALVVGAGAGYVGAKALSGDSGESTVRAAGKRAMARSLAAPPPPRDEIRAIARSRARRNPSRRVVPCAARVEGRAGHAVGHAREHNGAKPTRTRSFHTSCAPWRPR